MTDPAEDQNLFNLLVEHAAKHHDGHLTIMKFTHNWRVCFGKPRYRYMIAMMPVGETFAEAAKLALATNAHS